MNIKHIHHVLILLLLTMTLAGCETIPCCTLKSKSIAIYSDSTIPANTGISTFTYTNVDGYRYVNVAVEFEQNAGNEEALSLGVIFAHDQNGKLGSRRYFNFEENFSGVADPQMITATGKGSWSGSPHNKSHYIARLPIMGPYMQVFPFNHHNAARKFSIMLYLTE